MNSWGEKRKLLIEIFFGLLAIALIAVVLIAVLYKAPSCMDGKQDGDETGLDCGGSCSTLCAASVAQPVTRFVTAVEPQSGRTDVIAYIDNSNSIGGVEHARYTVQLRDPNGGLVASKQGTVNLPPSMTAPLYIPNVYDGSAPVSQAYLNIDPTSLVWLKAYQKPVVPQPNNIQIQDTQTPKITATLSNPTAHDMYEVTVVVTVFGASNNAIAASQTVVPILPAQGTEPLVFTWNVPFSETPARVEILPATGS